LVKCSLKKNTRNTVKEYIIMKVQEKNKNIITFISIYIFE